MTQLGDGQDNLRLSFVNSRAADERAIAPLIAFLRDHDAELRRTATVALGQFDDVRVIEALSEALAQDWDVQVRRYAAEGLGHAGNPSGVPILVKALADRSGAVREAAVEALGRVGIVATPALLEALRQSHSLTVRQGAVTALGRIADERAIAPFIEILRGSEYYVLHRAIVAAFGDIAARRPVPELRNALPVLRRATDPTYRLSQPLFDGTDNDMCRRVMREIEAATADIRRLPMPAAPPVLDTKHLPVPAQSPLLPAKHLPIPATSMAAAPRLRDHTGSNLFGKLLAICRRKTERKE